MLRLDTLRATATNGAFFLLFPGFFLFHFARGAWFPSFGLGLFGEVSAALFLCGLTIFLSPLVRAMQSASLISVMFVTFWLYCLAWTLGGPTFLGDEAYILDAAKENIALLVLWFALFVCGVFVNIDRPFIRKVLIVSWIVMWALVLVFLDKTYWIMNPKAIFGASDISSYQGFTRSAMVCSVAILAFTRSESKRIAFMCVSAPLLFFLGARSELFGFLFAVVLFEGFRLFNKPVNIILLTALLVLAIICFGVFFDTFSSSRQLNVVDLSQDTSWTLRMRQVGAALSQVMDTPVFGKYGGHLISGGKGHYAHNILSSWVSFGLVGFVLFFFINLVSFITSISNCVRATVTPAWALAFYLNASAFILIFAAKPVFWPMPAIGWGACVGAAWQDRIKRRMPINNIEQRDASP